MMQDPNWFFSTLSQSAAAIIGLTGGFLVSRLLQQFSSVRESRDRVIADFLELRNSLQGAVGGLAAYEAWIERKRLVINDALARGESSIVSNEGVGFMGGGWSSSQAREVSIDPDFERLLLVAKRIAGVYSDVIALTNLADLGAHIEPFEEFEGENIPEDGRNQHRAMLSQLRMLSNAASRHLETSLPRGSAFILLLLGWLALVGVVLPLTALSAGSGAREAVKYLLLVGFTGGVAGLLEYLRRLMKELSGVALLTLPEKYRLSH